jgi:hypothetical protein
MTFHMFDHLRILSDVLTASGFVLGLGALLICFKLLVGSTPATPALVPA